MGDPAHFLTLAQLQRQFEELEAAPADAGRVAFVMRRGPNGVRETPGEIHLVLDIGVEGDAWGRKASPRHNNSVDRPSSDLKHTLIWRAPSGLP